MSLASNYDSQFVEQKWYDYWMKHDFFKSVPDDRESYTIVIPPPNVTGVLHMGHMLNNTIQDVLIRRARLKVIDYPKEAINTGEEKSITISYDTNNVGPIVKTITVQMNVEQKVIALKLKGKVI